MCTVHCPVHCPPASVRPVHRTDRSGRGPVAAGQLPAARPARWAAGREERRWRPARAGRQRGTAAPTRTGIDPGRRSSVGAPPTASAARLSTQLRSRRRSISTRDVNQSPKLRMSKKSDSDSDFGRSANTFLDNLWTGQPDKIHAFQNSGNNVLIM